MSNDLGDERHLVFECPHLQSITERVFAGPQRSGLDRKVPGALGAELLEFEASKLKLKKGPKGMSMHGLYVSCSGLQLCVSCRSVSAGAESLSLSAYPVS